MSVEALFIILIILDNMRYTESLLCNLLFYLTGNYMTDMYQGQEMLNAFYISTARDDLVLPMFCIFVFFEDFFIPLKFLLSNKNCFTSAIKCVATFLEENSCSADVHRPVWIC